MVFIGVDYLDTEREALAYIDELNITYLNGPDIGMRISDAYRIQGVLETLSVTRNGELGETTSGHLPQQKLDERIKALPGEQYVP